MRDRLGSVVTLTNHHNLIMEHRSYDPFGKPRYGTMQASSTATLLTIASGTPFTQRGFTDHEHIDEAQLIHMNGRVYDYNLGRFLSVDPFIQAPGNSQSLNLYSYIMNNPLAGTDPSGYIAKCVLSIHCDSDEPINGRRIISRTQDYAQLSSNGNEQQAPVTNNQTEASEIGAQNSVNEGANRGASAFEALSFMWRAFWDNRDEVITGAVTGAAAALTENTSGLIDGDILADITGVKAASEMAIAGSNLELGGVAVAAVSLVAGKVKVIRDVAKSAGQIAREGEAAASAITGVGKNTQKFTVNGRKRIPDQVNASNISTRNPLQVTEVKNVKSQSFTRQLRDNVDLVGPGGMVDVFVRPNTKLSGPLRRVNADPTNPINIRPEL